MPSSSVLELHGAGSPSVSEDAGLIREIVAVFLAAQDSSKEPDLADFLPDAKHPLYVQTLVELICQDMDARWSRGRPWKLDKYRERFPEAFDDFKAAQKLELAAQRLRKNAPRRVVEQFESEEIAHVLPRTVVKTIVSGLAGGGAGSLQGAVKLANDEDDGFPVAGEESNGFDIVALIGQGSFAKVYLARQRELSSRLVVLKFSKEKVAESGVLAQLLHTNIIPVYSTHKAGEHFVTCMPFLGTTTLADVVHEIRCHGLPDSGRYLVETLQEQESTQQSSLGRASSREESDAPMRLTPIDASLDQEILAGEPKTRMILDNLESLSYCEAVLWLASQLADGLAHAHDRGILHRDLKPANVLLTNEGQPVLLDFNLAEDMKIRTASDAGRLGGTLLYMSPEQMQAFVGGERHLDGRSDIYSLGVILYELLTGKFPFPARSGKPRKMLKKLLADRRAGPPRMVLAGNGITPAIKSVVRKCLAADPEKRYQNARELEEDIRRHLSNLPLKYAREPSVRERIRKWRRRHPRLTSLTTMCVLAITVIAGLFSLVIARGERVRQFEAAETLQRFEDNLANVFLLLPGPNAEEHEVQRLLADGRKTLAAYAVLEDSGWRDRAQVYYLPLEKQRQLEKQVASLLLLMARAQAFDANTLTGKRRESALRNALVFNTRAEVFGAVEHLPCSLWSQRASFLALLDEKDAAAIREKAEKTAPKNSDDVLVLARELIAQRQLKKSLQLLKEATRNDSKNVPAWFLQGRCHEALGEGQMAMTSYTTCIALRPKSAKPYFRRGLVHLRRRQFSQARADFDRVIELEPKNANAFFNRGLAWNGLGKTKEAIDDLSAAMNRDAPYTRVWFLRSRFRQQVGDAEGATKDRNEGLRRTPNDEKSWISRGVAKLSTDTKGALGDFRQALRINPTSLAALANIAHVLAHDQKNEPAALAALDQLVAAHPSYVPGRSSRGLLLARMGRRGEALNDARECLKQNQTPANQFRVAGIYALTCRNHPADCEESLRLLRAALRTGYGHDLLERDPNLIPLRNTPEYQRLTAAVRLLRQ